MIRKQPLANGQVAVTFQMPASVWADSLFLVGDFNQWDKHSHPMRQRADGVWEITLELDAGREYQYRYLVNGTDWQNDWNAEASPFLRDYERLLIDFGTDYQEVCIRAGDDNDLVRPYFSPGEVRLKTFGNQQVFDFENLKGRLMSSSYAPEPGHPNFAPMIERLASIFEQHQEGGRVVFDYGTKVYYGQL